MSSDKPRRTSDVWVSQDNVEVVLRELRRRRQVTQKQIADEARVSPAAIARLENGDRRPSLSMLDKLAAVFATTATGVVKAAERITAGEDPDAVLDDLPPAPPGDPRYDTAASPAVPAEAPGNYVPVPMPHVERRLLELAERLEALSHPDDAIAVAKRLEALSNPDTATTLLRNWIAVATQIEALDHPDTAAALLNDAITWLVEHEGSSAALKRLRLELNEVLNSPSKDRGPLAATPTGEVRYVFAHAIGTDEHDQLWIDPLTLARTAGYENADPRVERYDNGQIVIDASRLDEPSFGPRDPDRHRVKVARVNPPPSERRPATDSLEQLYTRIVVEIHWPDGPVQTITPGTDASTDETLPEGTTHLHIITAHNPRSRLLRPSENQERNRLLHDELTRAGLNVVETTTRSLDGSWSEDSYAVPDADSDIILDLARRYEQTAILHWTAGRIQAVWTDPAASS